jgi:hypothetical protein
LAFSPVLLLAGKFHAKKKSPDKKSKDKNSFVEQGGQVTNKYHYIYIILLNIVCIRSY